MIAEVIAIGDELTSGQRLDTNSQWISQRLGDMGIRVLFHSTVGDDLSANVEVFRAASQRADVVIATGGLGPTADDLTRQAMAEAFNAELVTNPIVLEHIRQLFASRRREMPERNTVQAKFPKGSEVIPNPHGTAPGIHQQVKRNERESSHLFALPGVPAEMREMWEQTVEGKLIALLGDRRRMILHQCVKCFGAGESDLEQMLPDLVRRGRSPSVGITVSKATITLRVSAEGESVAACRAMIEPTVQTIHECLGELVFGSEDDELQHAVLRQLIERGQSLATVEWGSGGLLADWLSEADQTGESFRGGTVVRRPDGWPFPSAAPLDNTDVASLVPQAAKQVRELFSSDFGLAVGPFPDGATDSDIVPLTLATEDEVICHSVRFSGHPDILKARSTKQALNLLRLHLKASSG